MGGNREIAHQNDRIIEDYLAALGQVRQSLAPNIQ